jgi:hypothetical protein
VPVRSTDDAPVAVASSAPTCAGARSPRRDPGQAGLFWAINMNISVPTARLAGGGVVEAVAGSGRRPVVAASLPPLFERPAAASATARWW